MDIDHDNSFDDDGIQILSETTNIPSALTTTTSDREPFSKFSYS